MTEPTSTITDWDQFLRIWAILGPLAVAAVSALWARRTKSQDRKTDKLNEDERLERERARDKERSELEHAHELERLEQAQRTRLLENKNEKRNERYNEAKEALVNFMANSQEYTIKQTAYLGNKVQELKQELKQAATLVNDKYNYSYQLVNLIGNEAVRSEAMNLWNASIELPTLSATAKVGEPEYEKALAKYKTAKSEFSEVARKYLCSLDPHAN